MIIAEKEHTDYHATQLLRYNSYMFIVIDGPDGSGTSFHTRELAKRLTSDGCDVFLTAEPTKGPMGRLIRELLTAKSPPLISPPQKWGMSSSALQLLFTADRADHQSEIQSALDAGKTIICDRYYHSTYAYGLAFDLDLEWLKNMNNNFIHPDRVVFTMPPLFVCLQRIQKRTQKDSFEKEELQKKVFCAYERLAKADTSINRVDTSTEKEKVSQMMYDIIR